MKAASPFSTTLIDRTNSLNSIRIPTHPNLCPFMTAPESKASISIEFHKEDFGSNLFSWLLSHLNPSIDAQIFD
jgi:hypothetical protein